MFGGSYGLQGLHPGSLVLRLPTAATVDTGQHDQQEERGWEDDRMEEGQLVMVSASHRHPRLLGRY